MTGLATGIVLNSATGTEVLAIPPDGIGMFHGEVAADRSMAIVALDTPGGGSIIRKLALPGGATAWTVTIAADGSGPIEKPRGMAISPAGDKVVLIAGQSGGERHLVEISSSDGRITRRGPSYVFTAFGGLSAVAPSPAYPEGAYLFLGSRYGVPSTLIDFVYVLDTVRFVFVDSIPTPAGGSRITDVETDPTGRFVYVGSDRSIARYDLDQRKLLGSIIRPSLGRMVLGPDGRVFVLTRAADPTRTVELISYDPTLADSRTVRLTRPDGDPTGLASMVDAVFSPDGRTMVLLTGTAEITQLFSPERLRIHTIDLRAASILRTVPLDSWVGNVSARMVR